MGRVSAKDFLKPNDFKEEIEGVIEGIENQELVDISQEEGSDGSHQEEAPDAVMVDVDLNSDEEEEDDSTSVSRVQRFLSSHDEEFARKVEDLWNVKSNAYSLHHFCNNCGKKTGPKKKCCGKDPMKFVRNGVMPQLKEIMQYHIEDVLQKRENLRRGEEKMHNLGAPIFRRVWQQETPSSQHLHLSGILSVDGVSVPGSTNDCESQKGVIGTLGYQLHLVTFVGDQPAKRSVFGMKAHQCSCACFFCVSPGTFYKLQGRGRSEVRGCRQTIEDSRNGTYGFGSTPALIISRMMPYETPLDLLHNLGEGICERIMRELMSQRTKLSVKSQLFVADSSRVETEMTTVILPSELSNVHKNRNGTDKLTNFRCVLSSVAIHSDVIGPKGRFTIIALAMTANRMYTNANARGVFDIQMTAAANWFIQEASTEYLSSKCHFLSHTKGLVPRKETMRNPVDSPNQIDAEVLNGQSLYSTVFLKWAKLESEYANENTSNDVFFAKIGESELLCYRFVGGVSIDEKGFILAEPFHELENNAQFTSLQRARDTLRNADYYYASEVIEMLQSYEGNNKTMDFEAICLFGPLDEIETSLGLKNGDAGSKCEEEGGKNENGLMTLLQAQMEFIRAQLI
ncbi:hypothetical protein L3Y34_009690 [Caenorhabditis briggsae]|uniref:Uncharacterized protein n=1 Tax=Caenorhabditis briggsae TaxID=6238 RepID=A0AAE9A4R1_CAEBR|nr:hypothetical protein L3Y34_009690 [Caenorhabditis briggsae]